MSENSSSTATIKNIAPIEAPMGVNDGRSLQALTHLLTQKAVRDNAIVQTEKLKELKGEQGKVRELQKLQQLMTVVGDEGDLAITDEMRSLIEKAEKYGAVIPKYEDKLTKEQRVDMVDRLRVTTENINQDNDMLLQAISRITNVAHEMYALARTLMRTGHEILMKIIRKVDPKG